MSEAIHSYQPITVHQLVELIDQNQLAAVPVADLRHYAYDTSKAATEPIIWQKKSVHDVRESTAPGFPGWAENDAVYGTFTVVPATTDKPLHLQAVEDPETNYALQHRAQQREHGHFYLSADNTLDEPGLMALSQLGMTRFAAQLMVTALPERRWQPAEAVIKGIYAIDKPFNGNHESLRPDDLVLVQGHVVAYAPGKITNDNPLGAHLRIKLPNVDEPITINLNTWGGINYRPNPPHAITRYEELIPSEPIVGDLVQVGCAYTEGPNSAGLTSQHRGSIHLLQASDQRLHATLQAKNSLKLLVDRLEAADTAEVLRANVAEFIGPLLNIINEAPRLRLTDAEKYQIVKVLEKHPALANTKEWPAILDLSPEHATAYRQAFGDEVLRLSTEQLKDLAISTFKGLHIPSSLNAEAVKALFNQFNSDKETRDRLVFATIDNLYTLYKSMDADEQQTRLPYVRDLLQMAFTKIAYCEDTEHIAFSLLRIAPDVFSEGSPFAGLRHHVLQGFKVSLFRCVSWAEERSATVHSAVDTLDNEAAAGIEQPELLRIIQKNLPKLLDQLTATESNGPRNAGGGLMSDHSYSIDMLRTLLEAIDQLPSLETN